MDEQIERNRTELILALRSGRYIQCTTSLFKDEAKCVVGLIMSLFGIVNSYDDFRTGGSLWDRAHQAVGFDIPKDVHDCVKWPLWPLVRANDMGKTFPELADILVKDYNFPDVHVFEEKPELELETV